METIATDQISVHCDTHQKNLDLWIIWGSHRFAATWLDALGMVEDGRGYVREDGALRLIISEAFEAGRFQ